MNALISVAMATYNGSKYLKEQLDSIYAQTYKNFEVIVVDDASTDNTALILEQYKQKYGLKYVANDTNLGVTKNFEKAISLCSGDFIALVDQDDVWLPNKLEVLQEKIGDYSLIYSNAGIINEKSELQNTTTEELYSLYGLDSKSVNVYYNIVLQSILLGSATLFKRELITELIPMYESPRNHDWWLQVCAYNVNGIKYINDVLFYYRHHDTNYSRGKGKSVFQVILYYFSKDSKLARNHKTEEQYKIVKYLLEHHKYKTAFDKTYLFDIQLYCQSLLNSMIHVKAFLISLKYEKYMFLNKNTFINKLNLLSRLIK